MSDVVLFPYFAGEARTGMPPFIIFEGKLCSPDNIFISGEQELLMKINGGGAHRSVDYFFIVVFCVLCGVSERMCKCVSLLAEIHFKSL